MSYNIDDNYPWEVGLNGKDLQNYKLPTIVEVTITLKFVEAKSNTYNNVTDSKGIQDKTKIGNTLYGYRITLNEEATIQNENQFKSTNKTDVPPNPQKPTAETKQNETGDPYPNDSSPEALELQKRMKLVKANIFHTPLGQSKARQIYRQRKTDKLYFGDGTPYSGLGNADYIDTPVKNPFAENQTGFNATLPA